MPITVKALAAPVTASGVPAGNVRLTAEPLVVMTLPLYVALPLLVSMPKAAPLGQLALLLLSKALIWPLVQPLVPLFGCTVRPAPAAMLTEPVL